MGVLVHIEKDRDYGLSSYLLAVGKMNTSITLELLYPQFENRLEALESYTIERMMIV